MASPDRRARNWTISLAAAAAILVSFWMQTRTPRPPADSRAEPPAPIPETSPESDPRPAVPEPAEVIPSPTPPAAVFGAVYEVTIARPTATPPKEPEPTPIDTRKFDSRE